MKILKIEHRNDLTIRTPIDEIAKKIKDNNIQAIDCVNWPEYTHKPVVKFLLVQIKDGFYLNFEVRDDYIKALVTQDNGPVYKDSCVEFFIEPEPNGYYYNLEINCMGFVLFGYGNSRNNRELASNTILQKIIRKSSLIRNEQEMETKTDWKIDIILPFSVFYKSKGKFAEGEIYHCNFYKCGDDTKIPHYLSWNPIKTSRPDFHRPEFFGEVKVKETI